MATRNRLTDSGQKVRKGTAAQLGVKASKRRAAGELSTSSQRDEKTITKGPSASAKVNRNVQAANRDARAAAWRNSPEYKPIKTDELRTTNNNWGNAPLGDQYAVKYEQIEKKPYNAYVKNNYLTTKNVKLANEKATKALEKNGGKSRVKTKKTVNRGLEAGVAKRVGAMMPKSTGPAKKSTRTRKTSK